MKKIAKIISTFCLLLALLWMGTVIADRQRLNDELIRFHVVAASDAPEDQALKQKLRDAVLLQLQEELRQLPDADSARNYLLGQLDSIKETADAVLARENMAYSCTVTLEKERFPTRQYDTFCLPAGVYESLRITVGEGEGQNWWCVVFPSLCLPATSDGFTAAAAGAGFPDSLTGALDRGDGYAIRFFFLDCLGWLQNLFHSS